MISAMGRVLRRTRENAGLQQRDLADRTGIQMSRISRIENERLQPTREEIVSLLQAVGTEEGLGLVEDIERPLTHIMAPTWLELPTDEKEALRQADNSLGFLAEFRSRRNFRSIMENHVDYLRDRLLASAAYLVNTDHAVNFIGPIGVGKTTATNALFNLTAEFKKSRRKDGFTTVQGLLPTGTGRTTAFEYRLAFGPETSIRVERMNEGEILREVRNLSEYYLDRARKKQNIIRPMSEEEEKVYRNMAGLAEDREGNDPLDALITSDTTLDELFFQFRQRMNLPHRARTELSFGRDNEEGVMEGEWIRKRCRQLNYGLLADCPLPQNITIFLPNPALKEDGFHFTIVDTRGLAEGPIRRDITNALDDGRAVNVLCTRFFDAPTEKIQQVIELARSLGTTDTSAIAGRRLAMLVLPQGKEALNVTFGDGEVPSEKTQGYEFRKRQVKNALAADADHIEVLFFDAESDPAEDVRTGILSHVRTLREMARADIRKLSEDIVDIIENQEAAQFRETQRRVREKIDGFIGRHSQIPKPVKPTYLKLVKALTEAHASSVWSATKNDGYGRSINTYEHYGVYARQDAKGRTLPSLHGLDELINELLDHPDMKRTDMRRSRKYVTEVLEAAKLKHFDFLKQTQTIGENTLQAILEQDREFWQECISQRGHGPGYRLRVAAVVERWFDDHPDVSRKLDRRTQDAWSEIFIGWLKGYVGMPEAAR